MQDVKKFPRQIGPAPFAAARVLIEAPEGIPVIRSDGVARQAADGAAKGLRRGPFLAQSLALAAGQSGQKIVIGCISIIVPVKLLAGARHQAQVGLGLILAAKGDVERGKPILPRQLRGLRQLAGAQGPGHGRGRRPTQPARRHLQHQHGQGEHQRDAGDRVLAQAADDEAVIADDDRGREQAQHVRRGQAQQRGEHRSLQHALRGGRQRDGGGAHRATAR